MLAFNHNTMRPLLASLNYEFKDITWLQLALTHKNNTEANKFQLSEPAFALARYGNEQLELAGDAILSTVITLELMRLYPELSEGDLSRMRSNLVCTKTLTELALALNLGAYLSLGPNELKSGLQHNPSTLADAMEAVLAAVYYDSGCWRETKRVVLHLYADKLAIAKQFLVRDPKTQLQEWLQPRGYPLPEYTVIDVTGPDHNIIYTVACRVQLLEELTYGTNRSRKQAEQIAAEAALALLKNLNIK